MVYAVMKEAEEPSDSRYMTKLPSATNAGHYYIWYKAVDDKGHDASKPAYVEMSVGKASGGSSSGGTSSGGSSSGGSSSGGSSGGSSSDESLADELNGDVVKEG